MICHTPEECFQAGWDDGADDEPLSPQEIEQLVVLHGPHVSFVEVAS